MARELKALTGLRDDTFAATPPGEALKLLLSINMTNIRRKKYGIRKLMLLDIRNAHWQSPAKRAVYIDLPPEIASEGECALLLKSMYGTRDAAGNFAEEMIRVLREIGFIFRVFNPCLAWHSEQEVSLLYHGDDILADGIDESLDWFSV